MSQYALDLSLQPIYHRENFIVSSCNHSAWEWVENWPNWPADALYLSGPKSSGKSHIAHIWMQTAKAKHIQAADIQDTKPQTGNWLIEDITQDTHMRSLLHWLNYTRENGGSMLLTSRASIKDLGFTLKDLTSRLLALPTARIEQPDDAVLEGVLRKQFIDRQMAIDEEVITYIVARMERSLSTLQHIVQTLDKTALEQKRSITIPFIRETLQW